MFCPALAGRLRVATLNAPEVLSVSSAGRRQAPEGLADASSMSCRAPRCGRRAKQRGSAAPASSSRPLPHDAHPESPGPGRLGVQVPQGRDQLEVAVGRHLDVELWATGARGAAGGQHDGGRVSIRGRAPGTAPWP